MRALTDTPSITAEIRDTTDPVIATLLTRHLQFGAEFNADDPADLLTVFVIEPGDTLGSIDVAMNGCFLVNHYSRRRFGDPAFVPCFETLEEHATVYEMLFIQSDEGHALVVLTPKTAGIDPDLLALCAQHAMAQPGLAWHCLQGWRRDQYRPARLPLLFGVAGRNDRRRHRRSTRHSPERCAGKAAGTCPIRADPRRGLSAHRVGCRGGRQAAGFKHDPRGCARGRSHSDERGQRLRDFVRGRFRLIPSAQPGGMESQFGRTAEFWSEAAARVQLPLANLEQIWSSAPGPIRFAHVHDARDAHTGSRNRAAMKLRVMT